MAFPFRRRSRFSAPAKARRPYTPPLRAEPLEERALLAADLGQVKQHLAGLLDDMQPALNTRVLRTQLPVLGAALENYPTTQVFTALSDLAEPRPAEPPTTPNIAQVTQKLREAFGARMARP